MTVSSSLQQGMHLGMTAQKHKPAAQSAGLITRHLNPTTEAKRMKGTCLCSAIEVVALERGDVGLCHCSMCRRWSGGLMLAMHCGQPSSPGKA